MLTSTDVKQVVVNILRNKKHAKKTSYTWNKFVLTWIWNFTVWKIAKYASKYENFSYIWCFVLTWKSIDTVCEILSKLSLYVLSFLFALSFISKLNYLWFLLNCKTQITENVSSFMPPGQCCMSILWTIYVLLVDISNQ